MKKLTYSQVLKVLQDRNAHFPIKAVIIDESQHLINSPRPDLQEMTKGIQDIPVLFSAKVLPTSQRIIEIDHVVFDLYLVNWPPKDLCTQLKYLIGDLNFRLVQARIRLLYWLKSAKEK
jgi:hypothetical protein